MEAPMKKLLSINVLHNGLDSWLVNETVKLV